MGVEHLMTIELIKLLRKQISGGTGRSLTISEIRTARARYVSEERGDFRHAERVPTKPTGRIHKRIWHVGRDFYGRQNKKHEQTKDGNDPRKRRKRGVSHLMGPIGKQRSEYQEDSPDRTFP